jgi:hypothetical protein
MEHIHDRIPVILTPELFDEWLDADNHDFAGLQALLVSCATEGSAAYPVNPAINRGNVEGADYIEPLKSASQTFSVYECSGSGLGHNQPVTFSPQRALERRQLCASSCANMLIRYLVDVLALWVTRRA